MTELSRRASRIVVLVGIAFALTAQAQEKPAPVDDKDEPPMDTQTPADMPRGPAEIFKRNQEKPAAAAGLQAAQPPVETERAGEETEAGRPAPVGSDPHAGSPDAPPLARRPIASAEPSASLPPGTVRVRVVDSTTELPVSGVQLQLGTMTRENTRKTEDAKTSGDGEHRFEKLATGDGQAYRVNVLSEGAKYSSTPFRLPFDHGYEVVIRKLPTTRDARELVLYVGATSIELRDERLKIVQQARLVNIGAKTYVFPEAGQLIKLPKGFTAFQFEEVMTDQHLREAADQGLKLTGSIPPGEITLTWGFDIPYSSTEVDLSFDLPWVTFAYRVLADAAPGLSLVVDEMPKPVLQEGDGKRFWVSEVVKRVGEPPLRALHVHVRGIPGPGPMRIVATVAAVLVLLAGAMIARRAPLAVTAAFSTEEFEERRSALVERAASLASERERGEIGPEFHTEQLADLEEQLAALLYERSQTQAAATRKAA